MAEKRMFAMTIIDSDAFLDMPLSTQALYFHLNMRADDEGFINNPKKIQRMIGASDDDLKMLIMKSFIIPFESGIVVIKHWRIHNYIRGDRIKNTVYADERQLLDVKKNGSYTLSHVLCQADDSQLSVDCQADVSQVTVGCQSSDGQMSGKCQHRIEEYRLDKNSIDKNNIYSVHFEAFWKAYPRKKEKSKAYKCYQTRLKDGFSEDELLTAAKNYAEECKREHREEKYIKLGATFLSNSTPFIDYIKGGETDGKHTDYDAEHEKWVEEHREQLEAVRRDMFGV